MAWILLIFAGFLEILWAVSFRYTDGLTNIYWGIVTILSGLASFCCLAQAIKTIPLGTGYAVWTGIGAVGTAILGIALFAESAALPRLACMALIAAGIIGLKMTST